MEWIKLRRKTRTKVKKILKIAGIVVGIALLILGIFLIFRLNRKKEISYDDQIVCKNYFTKVTIDLEKKKVKRDNFNVNYVRFCR